MSMTASWAMPNKQMVLTPGRGEDDAPEDKLILKILAMNAPSHRSAPSLSRAASASSLPSGSGESLTRTMSRTESKGALARASSSADFGVPCYPVKSPYRREMLARTKSWRVGPRSGVLRVNVRKASGLLAADLSGFSDPYAVVHCGGQRRKTKIIEQTLEPVWEQTLEFKGQLEDFLKSGVRLQVFDWDEVGMDDVLGQCAVKLLPELMVQTTPFSREYEERLSPQGRLVFGVTWVPDSPRGISVVELAAQLAASKKADKKVAVPAGKERVAIPVFLPHKFDWLTDMWPLTPEQQAAQPRSNRPLSAPASHVEKEAAKAAAQAAEAGRRDAARARRALNDQSLNRMITNLTPRGDRPPTTKPTKASLAAQEKPKRFVLRQSNAHQFARPPSAKMFSVDAFTHSSQRYLDSTATRADVPPQDTSPSPSREASPSSRRAKLKGLTGLRIVSASAPVLAGRLNERGNGKRQALQSQPGPLIVDPITTRFQPNPVLQSHVSQPSHVTPWK